eukprot:g8445.t1
MYTSPSVNWYSDEERDMAGKEVFDTLLERLEKWCKEHPEKNLYTFLDDKGTETTKLSYSDVDNMTNAIATTMRQAKSAGGWGIEAKDRVLLVYPPSLDFIVAYLACLRAGVVAVPVFPPHPGKLRKDLQHFASIHQSSGAKVALTNKMYNFAKKVAGIKEMFSKEKKKWPDVEWILTDSIKVNANSNRFDCKIERSDLAFLQYTSGSTSEPKGVMITHDNLAHNLTVITTALKAGNDTVVCAWLPQYHDMGLIGSYLGTLYCGGSGVYMSPLTFIKSPSLWMEMSSKYKATHTQAPNFAYKLTARKFKAKYTGENKKKKDKIDMDLSSMKHMFNAAEPITPESINLFYETFSTYGLKEGVIVPGYGLAEHTVYVCDAGKQTLQLDKKMLKNHKVVVLDDSSTAGGDNENRKVLVGCGVPLKDEFDIHVEIVQTNGSDDEIEKKFVAVGEDEIGEVWVSSPSKANGYFGMDDATQEAFLAKLSNGQDSQSNRTYLRTGDLGFVHNSELFICGRDKDLIIIRGKNHYPQDIEEVVESDNRLRPGCSAAFSVVVDDEETLVVIAELRNAKEPNSMQIATEARQRVAQDHGVTVHTLILIKPRTVEKTSSGKIARSWAKKAYLNNDLQVVVSSSGSMRTKENDKNKDDVKVGVQAKKGGGKGREIELTGEEKRLVEEVAQLLELDPDEVELEVPLVELGMDSMMLGQLQGIVSSDFNVDLESEELFTETCTLNLIFTMIKNGGCSPNFVKQENDAAVIPIKEEEEDRNPAPRKKPMSTFEVIFCFCCRGKKKKKKGGGK